MRPQTCSATSLDTHRRALSRRPAAFFLATWTFLRHDSWAATYVYLHSTTATTATARSAEENFGASRAAAGVDAVVSQLGRGGAPLRFAAVARKSFCARSLSCREHIDQSTIASARSDPQRWMPPPPRPLRPTRRCTTGLRRTALRPLRPLPPALLPIRSPSRSAQATTTLRSPALARCPPPACLHVHASRPFPPSDAAV